MLQWYLLIKSLIQTVQTYDEMPAPVRPRHALANWTSIRIGNNPNRPLVNDTPHGNSHK